MELTATNVNEAFKHCLFKDDEVNDGKPQEGAVIVDGIMRQYGFHAGRIAEKRDDITSMLHQLPEPFMANAGGGWSLLNACEDRAGNLWTGMQPTVAELFALGMAIGAVEYLMPRELWSILPGGMPYLVVKDMEPVAA